MSKNINTFAAGLLALTSIAAASVGCQPQASEQTAANPTEFVEQTETVETEAASTFELTEEPTEEPTDEPTAEPTETPKPTAAPNPYGFIDDHGDVPVEVKILAMDDNPWRSRTVIVSERDGNKFLQIWKARKLSSEIPAPSELGNGGNLSISSMGEKIEVIENLGTDDMVYLYQESDFVFAVRACSSDAPKEGILSFGTNDGCAIVLDKGQRKSWEYHFPRRAPVQAMQEYFVQGKKTINYRDVMNG